MTYTLSIGTQINRLALRLLNDGFTVTISGPSHIIVEKGDSLISISVQHKQLREIASETQFTIPYTHGNLRMSTYSSPKRPPAPEFRRQVVKAIFTLFPRKKEETRDAVHQ